MSKQQRSATTAQRASKDRIMQVYVYTLQRCLMAHIRVLIEKGVDRLVESAARQIWLRTLDVTRCLEPGVLHRASQLYSPLTSHASTFGSIETRERELMSEDKISDHPGAFTSCLYRFLDVDVIVWIIYAALVWMQESITPLDLALWIERGELPFFKLSQFQEAAESRFRVYLPPFVFDLKKLPRPLGIEVGAAQLACDIGLSLPPVNIPLHIRRLSRVLDLSDDLSRQATALYAYYWRGSGLDQEKSAQHCYPQMIPLSCILAAMKLTYGLDDGQREIEGNRDWVEWSQHKWKECVEPFQKYSLVAKRLLEMPPSDCLDAMQRADAFLHEGHIIRKSHTGVLKDLQGLVQKWDFEPHEPPLDPKRPRAVGVEFGMQREVTYVPPQYMNPCPMYWFNHFNGYAGTDAHYPLDYTAVMAVLCGIANVQPGHVNACLATLEEQMKSIETVCIRLTSSKSAKPRKQISPAFERKALALALAELNYEEDDIEEIIGREVQQRRCIQRLDRNRVDRKNQPDDDLVANAVKFYQKHNAKKSLFHTSEQIPFVGLSSIERSAELDQWTVNPAELLRQARLAQRIGQPIVSLGTKRKLYYNLCISHARETDNSRSRDTFLSDVEPVDDDDD